jgi:DNA primase
MMATYTENQIEMVLRDIGVTVVSETFNDFTCLCPFHANRSTPALSVSKYNGVYLCFSPECGVTGGLAKMVGQLTRRNDFETARFIAARGTSTKRSAEEELLSVFEKDESLPIFDSALLKRLRDQFEQLPDGLQYMQSRGFNAETCEYFDIGYSAKQDMVTVPVHGPTGDPLGFVGRSTVGKDFKNSSKLPKSKTLFNSHRARKGGGVAIVTEASFDVMSLHQAGFDTGVALLGGNLSPTQAGILNRFFSKVIIFTDFDDKTKHFKPNCRRCPNGICVGHNPGRELGHSIHDSLVQKNVSWACYEPGNVVYPRGAKDATDLNADEIRQCINNSISHYEYALWDPR